jgi:hypothetical protein
MGGPHRSGERVARKGRWGSGNDAPVTVFPLTVFPRSSHMGEPTPLSQIKPPGASLRHNPPETRREVARKEWL